MGGQIFDCYIQNENLEWTCTKCALNDISTSLFNTSISSVESDIHDDKPKKKSKQLRISVCDFQSIWDKHSLLKHHLPANNIDILIGSESHLSSNISNSEFLPDDYTAVRDNRKDGYGGVIIVYKKHLMVKEITTNYNDGDFASIKIESYEKSVIICACYRSPNNNNNNNDNQPT